MPLRQYFHPPAIAAGFTAVLIGYTGSAVIIFQAAMSAGASVEQFTGWMMVLGLAMGGGIAFHETALTYHRLHYFYENDSS